MIKPLNGTWIRSFKKMGSICGPAKLLSICRCLPTSLIIWAQSSGLGLPQWTETSGSHRLYFCIHITWVLGSELRSLCLYRQFFSRSLMFRLVSPEIDATKHKLSEWTKEDIMLSFCMYLSERDNVRKMSIFLQCWHLLFTCININNRNAVLVCISTHKVFCSI